MGQDLKVQIKKASATQVFSFEEDCRAHSSIVNSASEFRSLLTDFSDSLNWDTLPTEAYSYSSRDFEETFEEGEDFKISTDCSAILSDGNWNGNNHSIYYRGFDSQDFCQKLSSILKCEVYGKDFQFSDGIKFPIENKNEKFRQKILGIKPNIENKTLSLFSYEGNGVVTMHPELTAIFEELSDALDSYQKGDFCLWETQEGMHFYAVWRQEKWGETGYNTGVILKRLKIEQIKGTVEKTNPLFDTAQQLFLANAEKFFIGNYSHHFFRPQSQGGYMKKIMKNGYGVLTEVNFSMEEFYPLGIELVKTSVALNERGVKHYETTKQEFKSLTITCDPVPPNRDYWDINNYKYFFGGILVEDITM